MSEQAELRLGGQSIALPVITGSDGSKAVNVDRLLAKTGYALYDPRLLNTAIALSDITWIDTRQGRLFYRGYNIKDLIEHSTFVETSYLLIHGKLPNREELREFSLSLSKHSMIHEQMKLFFDAFPGRSHPLGMLSTMVTSLSSYYPASYEENKRKGIDVKTRLLAKVRTLAAWSYKRSIGEPIIYPRDVLPYCENFLNMMFALPTEPYNVNPADARILNQMLILYADHEQNVATTTVRLVASTQANLFASISAGLCALWGARESFSNVSPIRMLQVMVESNQTPEKYFEPFIKGTGTLRTNGLGHKKYALTDPRADLSKQLYRSFLAAKPSAVRRPLFEKAAEVEQFVLGHPFFINLNLYPNLDFYSSLIFELLGIPPEMHNVVRAIGKLAGWLAHWSDVRENLGGGGGGQIRPQQIYTGPQERAYLKIDERS